MPEPAATPPPLLAVALDYLARGWPVFPVCRPITEGRCEQHGACPNAGKRPLVTWERYQTERPSTVDVTAWWRHWPTANIGMATGALSGIVVLDCDSSEARQLAMDQGVPPTRAVWTGKPGGIHYHLSHPGFPVSNFARKRPGLDFRGDGGYVLLPPSHHARGADYRWVAETESHIATPPDWLLDLIRAPANGALVQSDHTPIDLDLITAGIPEGQRDDLLWRYACKLRGDNVPLAYAEVFVRQAAAACRPPFDAALAAEKVARAYREYAPGLTLAVPALDAAPPESAAYPIKQIAAALDAVADPPPPLVKGLLWANRVHWVFSSPGVGKTLLMLAAGLHVAAGQPFGGRPTVPGTVLLIEEDSSEFVLGDYVATMADLYDLPLADLPFYYNAEQGLRLTDPLGPGRLLAAVDACPTLPHLVIIDACETVLPSRDFNSAELAPLRLVIQALIARGIAVVVIDHTRKLPNQTAKDRKDAAPLDLLDLLYGGRGKSAMSDVMLYLSGTPAKGLHVTFAKFRGQPQESLVITLSDERGFEFRPQPRRPRSPGEQAIIKFFNEPGRGWVGRKAVVEGTGVQEKACQRLLANLVERGWLQLRGDKRTTEYSADRISTTLDLEV